MNRRSVLRLGLVVAALTLALGLGGGPSPDADAQDDAEQRIAALETRVAELEREAAAQDRRIDRLEAGAVSTVEPAGEEGAADEAEQPDDEDEQAGAGAGTRDNPIPIGEAAEVGDWTVQVRRVSPNATELVLEENQFNEPPEEGRQFFLVAIQATYNGSGSTTLLGELAFQAVGASNVAYGMFDPPCGVIPNELPTFDEVFEGGTVQGNICFNIRSEDAASLVMYVEPAFSFDDDERVWFAVRR